MLSMMNNVSAGAQSKNRFASFVFPFLATFAIYLQLLAPSHGLCKVNMKD